MANEVARPNDGPTQPNRPASFRLDPNTVSRAELIKLGLSEKQADAFLKYRAKVSFTSADELAKIRILTPKNLAHLQPLVDIAPAGDGLVASNEVSAVVPTTYGGRVVTPQPYQPKVEPPLASLDINLATAEDWQSLPGIGPARSRKIINFREKLGGFSSIQQVGTTYGIPDSTFQTIQPFLQLGEVSINQLKINSLGAEDLKKHPYISRKLAEILVNYRNNHGPFRSESDLADIRILSESDRKRLLPYLDFSN